MRILAILLGAASLAYGTEQTLSIIKPDAVEKHQIGTVIEYLEEGGLKVVASRMVHLTPDQAKAFYAIHKDKPFYKDLVTFMTSGPVIVQVLEGPDAVAINRQIIGSKDAPGTIRGDLATDVQRNAVHGSDSPENAKKEIAFFFKADEIYTVP